MSRQKFNPGDTVRIAETLPDSMSHFCCDCEAIIVGSYEQQCGDGGVEEDGDHRYTVIYANLSNECSWYPEEVLTLVKAGTYESLMEVKSAYRKVHRSGDVPPEPPRKPSAADKEMTRQWMANCSGRDIAPGDEAEVTETFKDHIQGMACLLTTDNMTKEQRREVYDRARVARLAKS